MSGVRLCFSLFLACLWLAGCGRVDEGRTVDSGASLAVASLQAPEGTPLDDLLKGRVIPGFTPILTEGVSLRAYDRERTWLRLKARLPAGQDRWHLRIKRQGIASIHAYSASAPGTPVEVSADRPPDGAPVRLFPDSYYFPLQRPAAGGEIVVYLQIEGIGHVNFVPKLLSAGESARQDLRGDLLYALTYLGFLLAVALSLIRQHRSHVRMVTVAAWSVVLLLALLTFNGHLSLLPGGRLIQSVAPTLSFGLFVIAAGQALWATRVYAGMDRHLPGMARLFERSGLVLLMAGMVVAWVPAHYAPQIQLGLLALWSLVAVACLFGLAMDSRQTRWSAIFAWCGLLLGLLAIALAYRQVLPATLWVGVGFQSLLALLVLVHVVLPWLRSLMQARQMARRKPEPVVTPEERIAQAREQLMKGLNSALKAASDGDLEWIAFRRLLEGLKPVLPQAASAVIAMNYHSEDLLLVEPKEAKERYAMLLQQRGSMLRNLSRSTAPQQIAIDFDGPDGPLEHVQLAVIPLPIEKPGWGALLVERNVEQEYSDRELDMCAEFASLATTAGEEAAFAMEQRRAAEIDPDIGVYRRETFEPILAKAHDAAQFQAKSLSLLLVALDAYARLPEGQRKPAMRALADLIRDEAGYGQSLCYVGEDELLVMAPDVQIGDARQLADKLCAAARKHRMESLPGVSFQVSIGVAQMQPGEKTPQFMRTRAVSALSKAREYGGNQAAATDSAVL